MTHRTVLCLAAAVVACSITGAAPAAQERNAVIRMGKGIGKIQLGMTLPQVRRAFGRPHVTVNRRANFGSRGRYLELTWEFPGRTSWEPNLWTVGLRTYSRAGKLRVVRVFTTHPAQRTPIGRLGVGSWPRQIVRAYPKATCISRTNNMPHPYTWVVVDDPRAGMTAFNLDSRAEYGVNPTLHQVVAVMVQRAWYSKGRGHGECGPGWERL